MKKLSPSFMLVLGSFFYFTHLNAQVHYGPSSGTCCGNVSTYVGFAAGQSSTISNTFFGYLSGTNTTTGRNNTYVGRQTGEFNVTGTKNVFLGFLSGRKNTTGSRNTYLGYQSGYQNTGGSGNVFIGHNAGHYSGGISNELYIENSSATVPLIFGDFESNKVGINTKNTPLDIGGEDISDYSLFVKGGLLSDEVRVMIGWADYVFNENYKLLPLQKVEKYIAENGHLPNVPSAKTVEQKGVELGDMTRIQQEKIEELTLYIIDLNKRIEALEKNQSSSH